jgi:hypothetical protein
MLVIVLFDSNVASSACESLVMTWRVVIGE